MNRKTLDYIRIENGFGGNQSWLRDFWMKMGGCAAVTACDSSIYFQKHFGRKLYPFDADNVTKQDFIRFSKIMKPYLKPRMTGIDRLDIYVDGYGKYLKDQGEQGIRITPFSNTEKTEFAIEKIKEQIDKNIPIPFLLLKHQNPIYHALTWHWFILAGYHEAGTQFFVRVITYGHERWIDFKGLWNTGYEKQGGMILFDME